MARSRYSARCTGGVIASLMTLLAQPACAMDLMQAYQTALQQDSTVRAARAATEVGDERIEQAKAQRYPNIAFSAARNRNDLSRTQRNTLGRSTTVDENYASHNATFTLRQPIYRKALSVGVEQAHQ